jgi:predicted O-methyltransferase YrrM
MMITDEVARRLGLAINSESEYSGSGALGYQAFDDAGVECEVGEFLYAMVRLLKPKRILETGTHKGISTVYMALAVSHNAFAAETQIDTLEFLPELYNTAARNFQKAKLFHLINNIQADATKWQPPRGTRYDMALLDTEPQLRFNELVRFCDYIKPGGYIFIHDLHRHMGQVDNTEHGFAWPWGEIPHAIRELIEHSRLRPFHFPTPRGLAGFYKIHPEDYVWA